MIGETLNHLWQSTVFAIVAGLLTIAFRHNRAQIRYWLWFSASVKFLVPFTLLINLGSQLPWVQAARWFARKDVAVTIAQIGQPLPDTWLLFTPGFSHWRGLAILGVWACGFGSIALMRLRMWRRIRAAVRASTSFEFRGAGIPPRVQVRSAPGLLEPGVVGWLRPIVLVPAGIDEHLTPPELQTVFAHESCHLRRRDSFTAGIHMATEAVFWFHPLVWWIGARLVDERERACDEEVVRSGSNPRVYAESILKTCEFHVESRLSGVLGMTGSDLTKRIEAIMRNQAGEALSLWKKCVLATAIVLAVAIPIAVGVLTAPRLDAQATPIDASGPAFEAAPSSVQIDAANFCCPDYLAQMTDRIRANWLPQSEVDGSNVVKFTIQRDGRLMDVLLEESSGFQDLDENSRQALLATKALEPLPADFPSPTLTVHLGFQYRRDGRSPTNVHRAETAGPPRP